MKIAYNDTALHHRITALNTANGGRGFVQVLNFITPGGDDLTEDMNPAEYSAFLIAVFNQIEIARGVHPATYANDVANNPLVRMYSNDLQRVVAGTAPHPVPRLLQAAAAISTTYAAQDQATQNAFYAFATEAVAAYHDFSVNRFKPHEAAYDDVGLRNKTHSLNVKHGWAGYLGAINLDNFTDPVTGVPLNPIEYRALLIAITDHIEKKNDIEPQERTFYNAFYRGDDSKPYAQYASEYSNDIKAVLKARRARDPIPHVSPAIIAAATIVENYDAANDQGFLAFLTSATDKYSEYAEGYAQYLVKQHDDLDHAVDVTKTAPQELAAIAHYIDSVILGEASRQGLNSLSSQVIRLRDGILLDTAHTLNAEKEAKRGIFNHNALPLRLNTDRGTYVVHPDGSGQYPAAPDYLDATKAQADPNVAKVYIPGGQIHVANATDQAKYHAVIGSAQLAINNALVPYLRGEALTPATVAAINAALASRGLGQLPNYVKGQRLDINYRFPSVPTVLPDDETARQFLVTKASETLNVLANNAVLRKHELITGGNLTRQGNINVANALNTVSRTKTLVEKTGELLNSFTTNFAKEPAQAYDDADQARTAIGATVGTDTLLDAHAKLRQREEHNHKGAKQVSRTKIGVTVGAILAFGTAITLLATLLTNPVGWVLTAALVIGFVLTAIIAVATGGGMYASLRRREGNEEKNRTAAVDIEQALGQVATRDLPGTGLPAQDIADVTKNWTTRLTQQRGQLPVPPVQPAPVPAAPAAPVAPAPVSSSSKSSSSSTTSSKSSSGSATASEESGEEESTEHTSPSRSSQKGGPSNDGSSSKESEGVDRTERTGSNRGSTSTEESRDSTGSGRGEESGEEESSEHDTSSSHSSGRGEESGEEESSEHDTSSSRSSGRGEESGEEESRDSTGSGNSGFAGRVHHARSSSTSSSASVY